MDLKSAVDSFCSAHDSFLRSDSLLAVGPGMDPKRKGPNGIVIHASGADWEEREARLQKAKSNLPPAWEGHPVYFKPVSATGW